MRGLLYPQQSTTTSLRPPYVENPSREEKGLVPFKPDVGNLLTRILWRGYFFFTHLRHSIKMGSCICNAVGITPSYEMKQPLSYELVPSPEWHYISLRKKGIASFVPEFQVSFSSQPRATWNEIQNCAFLFVSLIYLPSRLHPKMLRVFFNWQ